MKKILFITVRNPFSGRYSGDVIRSEKFANYLSKKSKVQVVSLGEDKASRIKKNLEHKSFKRISALFIIIQIIKQILKINPIHFAFFYSVKMKKFINRNINDYDLIFCQSIRAFQYLPIKLRKKIVLDMGDLYSTNYLQTYKNLPFYNPLKFIYFVESFLIKKYEKMCLTKSNKVLLFSKKEINRIEKIQKDKILQINFGIDKIKNLYNFSIKNYKIIFIGNIKYAPNRRACLNFIRTILPTILKRFPDIEFHIFGEVYFFDKLFFMKRKNVKLFGKVRNLKPYLKSVICGLANLNISTGVQTKLLTYMSYGIPSICSKQVYENFDKIKSIKIDFYKNDKEFIDIIYKLKKNKKHCQNISSKSLSLIKFFKWEKTLRDFIKAF